MKFEELTNEPTDLYRLLFDYLSYTEKELEKYVPKDGGSPLASMCNHIVYAGGKRIRPLLTLLACEAVKEDFRKALPTSVAIELAHTLGLIQDDIFDQAALRRGVKPVHLVWGVPKAILASDFLFLKMVEAVINTVKLDGNSERATLEVLKVVVDAGLEAVEGEYIDLQLTERKHATVEECLMVARKKTGAFMKAALKTGAIIGGGKPHQINSLGDYGEKLGIVYQITDDILGLEGSETLLGKDVGIDLANGKITVIIAHALENCSLNEKNHLLKALGNKKNNREDLRKIVQICTRSGSLEFAEKLALEYANEAREALGSLPDTRAKKVLQLLPGILIRRKW